MMNTRIMLRSLKAAGWSIIWLCLGVSTSIHEAAAQPALTLDSCIEAAWAHLDFESEAQAIEASGLYGMQVLGRAWYPEFGLNYSSTWQNEQIAIPIEIPIPGFEAPSAPRDFHRILLEFRQALYDGGSISRQRALENANAELRGRQLLVEKLDVRARVHAVFMAVLLADVQAELNDQKREILKARLGQLESALREGAILESELQLIKAELLSTRSDSLEIVHARIAATDLLAGMTGLTLSPDIRLEDPMPGPPTGDASQRPELGVIEGNLAVLQAREYLATSALMPRAFVFATGGVGTPGYDLFNSAWRPMLQLGVGLRWSIWDWNETALQRKRIEEERRVLTFRRDRVRVGLEAELQQAVVRVAQFEALLENDDELIKLRESIAEVRGNQLTGGVITATDYIEAVNSAQAARLGFRIHELQRTAALLDHEIARGVMSAP